jgi:hypothetical protein
MNCHPTFVLLSFLIVPTALVQAQALETPPSFEWAASASGDTNGKTRCVTVDREGNVFLAGEMTGEAKFGDITIKSTAGMDFFVAKLDAKGKFLWARHGGGALVDRGYGVATDTQGNCYVTGHCQSTDAEFDGVKLGNAGDYDAFVAKYDRDGKLAWIHTMGGKGYDYGHAIVVDGNGDVIVAGAVVGESKFGDKVVPNEWSGGHPFCAKYSSGGELRWVKTTSGKVGGSVHGVGVDAKGNIYLGGMTSGNGMLGSKPLVTSKGGSSLVAKMSPEGDVLWVAQNFGEPSCMVHELTADAEGRVWASGMFKGKATFGDESFNTTGDKNSDAYLAHYDTEGKLLWVRVGQGPEIDYGLGVATDGKGSAFLTGEFNADFKLAGATLKSLGSADIYVAKFDEKGTLRWVTQAGGENSDNAYTMAHDASGGLVIAGSFGGTAAFGKKSLSSTGGNDLYAAKLAPHSK